MYRIYFDNAATVPLSAVAKAELLRAVDIFGNPSSSHSIGLEAERYVRQASADLAAIMNANGNIIYTSGGTESNNLAIFGAVGTRRRGRVITASNEHPSVAEPFKVLAQKGFEVITVPAAGGLDTGRVIDAVNAETLLVSVMAVNNETGAINDVEEIGNGIKRKNADTLFHSDCVQAFTKHEINVQRGKVDMMSACGHKIGAPKGVGLLYVRGGVRLKPLVYGGGQQRGIRPGTENTAGIGAFAAAAKAEYGGIGRNLDTVSAVNGILRDYFQRSGSCVINVTGSPYILSVDFPSIKSEILMRVLEKEGLYVSAGAACSSKTKRRGESENTLRFSFSAANTAEEARAAVRIIDTALKERSF